MIGPTRLALSGGGDRLLVNDSLKNRITAISNSLFRSTSVGKGCAALAQDKTPPSQLTIHGRDHCDPASFNAALGNGASNRDTSTGAINITDFLTELTMAKSVGAWRFAPSQTAAAKGATLNLQNLGGETHTFTRVKRFGGDFVAPLNAAAGTPRPAPECAQMVNGNLFSPASQPG